VISSLRDGAARAAIAGRVRGANYDLVVVDEAIACATT